MRIPLSSPLDLDATLYSGQAFRWSRAQEGWHAGYVRNQPLRVRRIDGAFEWQGSPSLRRSDLARYFRLDGTHEEFLREVPRDALLERALQTFPGLRLLNQDPWEVFIAYIVSQNSNIPKISRTLESLAVRAGKAVEWAGRLWHRFPTARQLAALSESELRATGMGYRAPFVRAAAQVVADGRLKLSTLRRKSYSQAKEALLEIPGIGEKVADCVLLYGLGHLEAFPTDVWIERVMREVYFRRRRVTYPRVAQFARNHFGPRAGYAQHFLFHYRRVVGPFESSVHS